MSLLLQIVLCIIAFLHHSTVSEWAAGERERKSEICRVLQAF